jgi:hypothetical protein
MMDPIDRLGATHPATHRMNPIDGEDRLKGRTYQINGWFGWGDARKVSVLRELAEAYGEDAKLRWKAAEILRASGIQPRDYRGQAAALLAYVQNAIYYTNEPGEQIQSPWRTLAEQNGDCDDMALLYASFLESLDFPWKFALAGRRYGKPARWIEGQPWLWGLEATHIYVVVGVPVGAPSQWLSAEPTVRGLPLGHDVVLHGLPNGVQAADIRSSPAAGGSSAAGSAVGGFTTSSTHAKLRMAGWGDPGSGAAAGTVITPPSATLGPSVPVGGALVASPGFLSWIDWRDVTQEAVKAVVIAVAVGLTGAYMARQNRKRC